MSGRWRTVAVAIAAGGLAAAIAWWVVARWRATDADAHDGALTSALLRVLRCVQSGDVEAGDAIDAAAALLKQRRAPRSTAAQQVQADCITAAVNGSNTKALSRMLEGGFEVDVTSVLLAATLGQAAALRLMLAVAADPLRLVTTPDDIGFHACRCV